MKLDDENLHDKLRIESWNNALHTYGTAYIYNKRNRGLRNRLKWITFLGIIVPILIGAVATGYGIESEYLKVIILITTPISIVQLIISTWSLIAKWNDTSEYYTETSISNNDLSANYVDLAKYPPPKEEDLKNELEKINIKKGQRDIQDSKYSLLEKEKREGMRYALRKFRRECVGCNETPTSMNSTECEICGKF